ncbi:MAG: hypothetical protein WCO13_14620 [Bacteroidota bacterium]
MSWEIECCNNECPKIKANNIVDLINKHRDNNGLFLCSLSHHHGFIKKTFALQEKERVWNPYLKGIITLGKDNEIYQPFVFIVADKPNNEPDSVWFSYYKDLRGKQENGKLKIGYGPGGPPVLKIDSIKELLQKLNFI